MNKVFSDIAWEHYQYWIVTDKKILKKVNELIRDIERNGNEGIGKTNCKTAYNKFGTEPPTWNVMEKIIKHNLLVDIVCVNDIQCQK